MKLEELIKKTDSFTVITTMWRSQQQRQSIFYTGLFHYPKIRLLEVLWILKLRNWRLSTLKLTHNFHTFFHQSSKNQKAVEMWFWYVIVFLHCLMHQSIVIALLVSLASSRNFQYFVLIMICKVETHNNNAGFSTKWAFFALIMLYLCNRYDTKMTCSLHSHSVFHLAFQRTKGKAHPHHVGCSGSQPPPSQAVPPCLSLLVNCYSQNLIHLISINGSVAK